MIIGFDGVYFWEVWGWNGVEIAGDIQVEGRVIAYKARFRILLIALNRTQASQCFIVIFGLLHSLLGLYCVMGLVYVFS